MEALIGLLGLYLFAVLIVLPIWTIVRLGRQSSDHDMLRRQVGALMEEIKQLRAKLRDEPIHAPAPVSPAPNPSVAPVPPQAVSIPTPAVSAPPPIPVALTSPVPNAAAEPPPLPPPLVPVTASAPPRPAYVPPVPVAHRTAINWEQFMGAKLFAWLGGLALFLGVTFFVKYSFDHRWIPDAVRVALGFIFGAGLIVGGLKIAPKKYAVTSQTLIATGVVSLYAVTFACGREHYNFLNPTGMFLVMALITATAFILAVRLDAQVVAILGLLGGFLTPKLLSTGVDNPGGLFGYVALLDAGLVAVALYRRWSYLVALAAAGTVVMLIGWAGQFYVPEKTPVAMTACLAFCGLFLAAAEIARRRDRSHQLISLSAAALPLVSFGFALYFLDFPVVAEHAGLYFGFVLLADAALLALAWNDESLPRIHLLGGLAAFTLIATWTARHLTDELMPCTLAAYLIFAVLHTAFPLVLQRHRPAAAPTWWSQLFPPLTLLLMLFPIYQLDEVPFLIWPAILLVDLLAIGLAVMSASIAAVVAVLVLTLFATALCIFKVSAVMVFAPSLLLVIGGFAVFFFAASLWLAYKFGGKLSAGEARDGGGLGDARAQLPAFASLLPFLLLIMVCLRLTVPDPTAVFGLGLLLVVLTLGLACLMAVEWLPACALAGMTAVEYAWHSRHFTADSAALPLVWYLSFYIIFAVFPFLFRRTFARVTGPWAVAALSGLAHFWMVYQTIKAAWPNNFLGLVPALFALAPLASLMIVLRTESADNPKRLNQLAWFGGVALAFITLIFPIQFDRQWLTVAWALEGAALLWLFLRVPHDGLRATGVVLLLVAFVRLSLNPAVFNYHVRGDTAIFNWYLYAYGLTTAALFAGSRLMTPPADDETPPERVFGLNVPPLLNALGVILAFILLNIEIADYFTLPGAHSLAFKFSGNFARDMSYTIGWALFALGLLVGGIWKKTPLARYTAIALLSIALLKLFFHDMARLDALYRIGAFFAVAIIAIVASFAYQRFLPSNEKTPPPQP